MINHKVRKQQLSNNQLDKSLSKSLVAVIGTLLVSCSANAPQGGGFGAVPVPIAPVESGIVTDSSDYVANLQSRQSVTLQPRVDGYVQEIFVKAGDRVEAGAPILRIDPARQQAVVQRSVAAVATSQADFESARATLAQLRARKESILSSVDFNQKEFERFSKLTQEGATAKQKLDEVANSLRNARAELGQIDAQINAQQASINSAATRIEETRAGAIQEEVQLDFYTVTAPFAGIVGDIPIKVGDNVNSATQLTTVTQNQVLEVQISVPLENAPRLKMGQSVELLDAQDKPIVKGNVAFISPSINPQTQSVLVKANFNNGTNQLKANQFVRARLIWASRSGVLVPTSAISRLGGQDFIFVAENNSANGKTQLVANQKPIKLGKITGNKQEVLEGLKPNDKIVVSGILQLQNGAPIAPLPDAPKQ
ncbi:MULTISPECIES: efflux RND transporter periplasmic adaptor subunit [Pseudanabaena]|uniref:efflux RND transporter periplasmic adaptor subunit n=1 Tax=Pseudanabaena TaxID=1152 RepID=UPI00247A2316|nr:MULTISPECIES: efflux RND transporter periplasmic adaptor subunit [Pseudanabaena]MEA5485590.1 efflux RND transporter periplasmic adaptor subunit [Pseudanabaena sp. CCNP1317]WGS70727.1 efflux RND transporter periplasmic adaptor subunit [Pseudanabaena galeata CCNP1313]